MATTLPLAEVKAHLSEIVARVGSEHDRVLVTVHGVPSAFLIAPADLESLNETIAILSDSEAMRRLETADAELAAGLGEPEDGLAEAMERRRGTSAR